MALEKLLAFTKDVQDLPDKPNATMTTADLKVWFDSAPNEVRQYLNTLIDDLSSVVDGDSGADNIGVTPIANSPDKLQGVLEWLKTQLDNVVLGQIPTGTVVTPEEFNAHAKNELNPHKVTAAQLGAVKTTDTANWQKHKLTNDVGTVTDLGVNVDFRTITTPGFYRVSTTINAPTSPKAVFDNYYVEVQVYLSKTSFVKQIAYDVHGKGMWHCTLSDGVWGAWTPELFTSVDNGKLAVRTAILGNGGTVVGSHPNSFTELENGVKSLGKVSGTLPAGSASRTVNTLTFSPSYVILWAANPSASSKNFDIRIIRSTAFPYQGAVSGAIPFGTVVAQASVGGANNGYQTGSADGTFSANGFTANGLDINSNYDFVAIK